MKDIKYYYNTKNIFINSLSFANVFVPKNEDFGEFAKVLTVKFLPKVEFTKFKFARFYDFIISRNFLPLKYSRESNSVRAQYN